MTKSCFQWVPWLSCTKHFRFVLPSASDNTAAESSINRLFTTSDPLSGFLKTVAEWSARSNVRLALTHLAGEKNIWADELSRNRLHRFAHRTHERERISLAALASPRGTATLHPAARGLGRGETCAAPTLSHRARPQKEVSCFLRVRHWRILACTFVAYACFCLTLHAGTQAPRTRKGI